MKYSIITIASNGLKLTAACIESIYKYTEDFELIIVDNNSTDGTKGYLRELRDRKDNISLFEGEKSRTFSENNNIGLKAVSKDSEYVIFLNNDTVVTKDWAERMRMHFEKVPMDHIGAVGPVCNRSNGKQMVGVQDPDKWHAEHRGRWTHAGILYGWCLMVKKSVIDEVGGFDERFINGHEDNDLCLRIQLAGYKLITAYDTYIHHVGQGTLFQTMSMTDYMEQGYANREQYFDKYASTEKKKLVAVYRTNGGPYLAESLTQTSKFADSIILHLCRANVSEKELNMLRVAFPKIVKVQRYDGIFQEDYERGWLMEEALRMHEAGEADWCISIDDDEIYEDSFIGKVQKMMNPRNPEIFAYWCQWRTIWKKELGVEYYRTDSTFGQFSNYRFFRLIKNQKITSKHPEGHHCGSAPFFADENLRFSKVRIRHMGYDTPEQRKKKFDFYEANDHFKDKKDIGYDDYSHLISKNVQLEVYEPNNGVSLVMMVKNEEEMLLGCLENVESVVDEMIIVDTGSTDKTIEIVEAYAKHAPVPVLLYRYPWKDNYSLPRNYGKSKATMPWILHMDADERIRYEDLGKLFRVTETDIDICVFDVANYLEKAQDGVQPKVAPTQSTRIYKNIPELFYSGIIHETFDDSLRALNSKRKVKRAKADFILHHYGYIKNKGKAKGKLDYYETLNDKQIEITEGKDARPFFNLALHYLNEDKKHDALKNFQKALQINPNFYHAAQQMAALNIDSSKVYLTQALSCIPTDHPSRQGMIETLRFLEEKWQGFQKVT